MVIEHPDYLLPFYKAKLRLSKTAHSNPPGRLRVLKVSAKDEVSTLSQLANLRNYIKGRVDIYGDDDAFLDRLVYTLGQKRSKFPWSSALPISTPREILDAEFSKPQNASRAPRIGFVFSGQGAQWHAMGRELIMVYPVFREALREADSHLRGLGAPWSLIGMTPAYTRVKVTKPFSTEELSITEAITLLVPQYSSRVNTVLCCLS